MKRQILIASVLIGILLLQPQQTLAVCPVCTVAVGAGIGLSRWLGVDDLISGVWVGGLIVSMIYGALNWLDQKKINFDYRWLVITVVFYALTILPLVQTGIIGHPYNQYCGIDKLLFGIGAGSITFFLGNQLNLELKKRNQNKVYFPFQKVAIPLLFLAVASLILYIIAQCNNG